MKKKLITILLATIMFVASGAIGVFAAGNQAPATPTGLSASSSYNAIILSWNAVSGADGYVITWSGNGAASEQIWITNPAVTTYMHQAASGVPYYFTIQSYVKNPDGSVAAYSQYAENISGEAVKTLHYSITFKQKRTLTSHSGGKKKVTIPKGTTVTAWGYTDGRYMFDYTPDDGITRVYYVTRISVKNQRAVQLDTDRTYTRAEAESFVNRIGLSSRTKYLIWVNTATQKLYIFQGSQGNWTCINDGWTVATGSVRTPTSSGLTRIKQKVRSNGAPFWNVCSYFSIHGNARVWGALGTPKSNGCVRNTYDHARWIYYNCKKGTAVYVY